MVRHYFLVIAACGWALVAPAKADDSVYMVDGLALGASVQFGSSAYREYKCQPSEQYRDMTVCTRTQVENGPQGPVTSKWTILHETSGRTIYINKSIDPAFLNPEQADAEIARLSAKFGQQARVLTNGAPAARIASWGTLRLSALEGSDIETVKSGESPHKGFMVSFLEDFGRGARAGLPVFVFAGGSGFVWNANFDENGRGRLRFLAADATRMSAARYNNDVPTTVTIAQIPVSPSSQQNASQPPSDLLKYHGDRRTACDGYWQYANRPASEYPAYLLECLNPDFSLSQLARVEKAIQILRVSAQCPFKSGNSVSECRSTSDSTTLRFNCTYTQTIMGEVVTGKGDTTLNYENIKSTRVCEGVGDCVEGGVVINDRQNLWHTLILCDKETAQSVKIALDILIQSSR
jgi:hypothetical protein